MRTIKSKDLYGITKQGTLQSVRIINNIEGAADEYYKVNPTENDIKLNFNLEQLSLDQFLYQIYDIGMKYAEVFIHKGRTQDFISLDEFISYAQLAENSKNPNRLIKHPSTKEPLNKEEFLYYINLYINERFMLNQGPLVTINYNSYKQGGFYYNLPYSPVTLGCELEEEFWAFSWYRYI